MANQIEGSVTQVGPEGNLISDIANDRMADVPTNENTVVKFGEHETVGIFSDNHDQPNATMVASLGKSGFLEIEIVGINLSEMLGIKTGEKISVRW